jgi:hypothetical protein
MGKNWLIRTKSNHILGPISKEKVIELYQNGSIKADDEICSGNGYWFFIREIDLVNKYLLGSHPQSFNPISEAKDILTSKTTEVSDHGVEKDDITMVGEVNLSDLKAENVENKIPDEVNVSEENQKKKNNTLTKKNKIQTQSKTQNLKNQNFLKYSGMAIFIVLFLVIYFRKTIFKSFFRHSTDLTPVMSLIIDSSHAQESIVQKKNF